MLTRPVVRGIYARRKSFFNSDRLYQPSRGPIDEGWTRPRHAGGFSLATLFGGSARKNLWPVFLLEFRGAGFGYLPIVVVLRFILASGVSS